VQGEIDIVVIGAGPSGLGVAIAAREQGLGCLLIEKGCITSCIAGYPTYGGFFSTPDKLELGGLPFITVSDKPTRREALKYYRRVAEHFELEVRQYEEVVGIEQDATGFILRTRYAAGGRGRYRARNVVVATGYWDSPNLLGVPGEELPQVTHYYREGLPYWGQDCLVVGGGNSAVESALDLYRSGARVTMVQFADEFDRGVKPWVLPDITGRIEKGEISMHWRTRVAEILPGAVRLRSEVTGEIEEVDNDFVFAMTGYTPDPWLLRQLGVTIDAETGVPLHDPATMETDVTGVFIAGVVAGGNRPNQIFIENSREHGPRIVQAVCSRGVAKDSAGV
jgi:thioredoxin reductase (NADPH)